MSKRIRDWHNKKVEELEEEQLDRDKMKQERTAQIQKEVQAIME